MDGFTIRPAQPEDHERLGDLTAAGIDTDEATVRRALEDQAVEARRQLMAAR